ncbi:phospholipase-like protein [Artemisia annua]|uniref:Phospholipase-like protein n=1 Tax=Artemisia annua TaxID=35608 RepID=A0A2U1NKG6_ARTAN|nr:phospholipase-like protein [Artemisia annua]
MAARLSTSSVKQLADEAMDAGKKLQMLSSTAETINILAQVEQILYRVQQSPSRSTAKALDPIVEALIAEELLNHPDIDVNISVACCICDVLTITTPYNHGQMKLDGLIVRLFKQFLTASESNSPAVVSKMEKILTMILGESKVFPHELVGLLTASVKKDNQIVSPVCSQLGEKVLKNCAARLSKPHLFDTSLRRCQHSQSEKKHKKVKLASDPPVPSKSVEEWNGKRKRNRKQSLGSCQHSQSEKKHEKMKLSSIDPPVPSESVKEGNGKNNRNKKQAQSVEHGENLVGKRIKVWWPADKKYYEGVVESYDCSKKRHKVSYDDGEVERLNLKCKKWELVENVSPTSDCLEAVTISVASPETGMTCVQGYKVKNINAPILESIFKKHGDIAANCAFISSPARESVLEVVCEVVRKIQTNDETTIISAMEELQSQVSAAEAIKVNVSWLQAHLEAIHKRTEAKKKCSLLMKMTANTSLVTIAAKMDLKERRSELETAQKRFEKAERCVEVLNLVKKKLNDNFLESKTEKDSWVEQPILALIWGETSSMKDGSSFIYTVVRKLLGISLSNESMLYLLKITYYESAKCRMSELALNAELLVHSALSLVQPLRGKFDCNIIHTCFITVRDLPITASRRSDHIQVVVAAIAAVWHRCTMCRPDPCGRWPEHSKAMMMITFYLPSYLGMAATLEMWLQPCREICTGGELGDNEFSLVFSPPYSGPDLSIEGSDVEDSKTGSMKMLKKMTLKTRKGSHYSSDTGALCQQHTCTGGAQQVTATIVTDSVGTLVTATNVQQGSGTHNLSRAGTDADQVATSAGCGAASAVAITDSKKEKHVERKEESDNVTFEDEIF